MYALTNEKGLCAPRLRLRVAAMDSLTARSLNVGGAFVERCFWSLLYRSGGSRSLRRFAGGGLTERCSSRLDCSLGIASCLFVFLCLRFGFGEAQESTALRVCMTSGFMLAPLLLGPAVNTDGGT